MQPAAVLSIMVRSQGVAATAGELGRLDKAGRSAGAGLQKTEGHAKRASKSFSVLGSTAKLAGVTLGAAGLAKGLSLAVSEYREAQKVGAQTNAVLKSTGSAANVTKKHVQDLANAISLKAGIDDEAIQKGQNLLLTFRDIRNETGKGNKIFDQATQAITDVSVAMDQGMKQSAVQVGKALNDPIKGMTALRRIGVTFTQGQVDTVKKLVDTGHKLEAQKLILRELNKEFSGSAAAQATAGDKLKVAWNNLAEAAGGVLVPQLDKLAVFFTNVINAAVKGEGIAKFIVPAFNEIKQSAADLIAVLGPLLAYLGPRLVSAFNALPAPIKAVTIAFAALGVVLAVSSPVMAGLAALAAAAILIHRNWSTIEPIIVKVGAAITAWRTKNAADIAIVIKAFNDVATVVRAVLQVAFPVAAGIAKRAMEGARQAIAGTLQVLTGVVNVFLGVLHGDWSRVWGGLKDIAAGAIKGTLGVLRVQTAAFREVGARMAGAVIDGLSLLGHTILNKFKDAANFVIKNVGDLFKGIGGAISKGVGKINPFGDGVGKLPVGGKGSAALMGASAALAPFANAGARFGLHVSSGLRPGAITTSGNVSYHSTGEAIDEAGPPAGMMAFFKYMKSNYGGRLAELIYGPGKIGIKNGQPFNFGPALNAQHMDHVHVALDTGKPGPGDGIGKVRKRMRNPFGDGLGKFVSTSYGPPWGGIQGGGVTATGVNLKGSPHTYGIAVDPKVLSLGQSYNVWPNPFGYHGSFKAFDTGGAIKGNRIDFYDWRGRKAQMGWGKKTVTVTAAGGKAAAKAAKKSGPSLKASSKVTAKTTGKRKFGTGFSDQQIAEFNAQADHNAEIAAQSTGGGGGGDDTSTSDNTDAINALTAQLALANTLTQRALATANVSQSQYSVLAKAIADVASGQIGGRVGLGFMSPSFPGGGSRY